MKSLTRLMLLTVTLASLTLGVLSAPASAIRPVTCPGDGCFGGSTQCAKLPNGSICYTLP